MERETLAGRASLGDTNAAFLLGERCHSEKKPILAFMHWKKAAERGHMTAMNRVGAALLTGYSGEPTDAANAALWFRKAASLGSQEAYYSLGILYEQGLGVSKDVNLALHFYGVAAQQGEENAQYKVGILSNDDVMLRLAADKVRTAFQNHGNTFLQGHGLAAYELAFRSSSDERLAWLKVAAKAGHTVSQFLVGCAEANKEKAIRYLRFAARQGHWAAQQKLAQLLYEKEMYEESVVWLERLAERGDAHALYVLGGCHLLHQGVVGANRRTAMLYFEEAAARGYVQGIFVLGLLALEDGHLARGANLLREAASKNHIGAAVRLAWLLWENKEFVEAVAWWTHAAFHGNMGSVHALAQWFEKQDASLSLMYYRKLAHCKEDHEFGEDSRRKVIALRPKSSLVWICALCVARLGIVVDKILPEELIEEVHEAGWSLV